MMPMAGSMLSFIAKLGMAKLRERRRCKGKRRGRGEQFTIEIWNAKWKGVGFKQGETDECYR